MLSIENLAGRTVIAVRLEGDNTLLQFDTDQGPMAFETKGECCSESWINHISGIEALIGQKVDRVDEISMGDLHAGDEGFSGKNEEDKVYMFKIYTSQGSCDIEMRNASNGYYGGTLRPLDSASTSAPIITKDF